MGTFFFPLLFLKKFTNFFTSGSLAGLDVSGGLGIQRCFYPLLDYCLQIRLYASESDVHEVRIWYTHCQKPINRVGTSSYFHEITRVASANPLMFIISIAWLNPRKLTRRRKYRRKLSNKNLVIWVRIVVDIASQLSSCHKNTTNFELFGQTYRPPIPFIL